MFLLFIFSVRRSHEDLIDQRILYVKNLKIIIR